MVLCQMVSPSEAELSNRKWYIMSKITDVEDEHPLESNQVGGKGLSFKLHHKYSYTSLLPLWSEGLAFSRKVPHYENRLL